jgi:UDPglucose 6-dehydrogenase
MNVAILGTGYVGLVSGVCLAARGHHVTCLDIDAKIVERLNRGDPHIYERGLADLLALVIREGRFKARLANAEALAGHPIVLVAVGTPSVDGRIDLTHVGAAAATVGAYVASATQPVSVIVKSTVLPGTTDTFVRGIIDSQVAGQGTTYGLGMNPEFLREGEAVNDFMDPDRIVLGHEDEAARDDLRTLYEPWSCTKIEVNSRTAEMIKYVNNCLLATQISAINELANVAAALGRIDIRSVLDGLHADRRWNPIGADGQRTNPGILRYLIPGGGFGGSCFPKDVQALRTFGRSLQLPMQLLQAVLDVNDRQPREAVKLLEEHLGDLGGRRVLVLGLAFKPGTDDIRESPAIRLVDELVDRGAKISVHDPMAAHAAATRVRHASVTVVDDWRRELRSCEGVVVATAWPEYLALRDDAHRRSLIGKVLVDTRFLLSGDDLHGVAYRTIGGSGTARTPGAASAATRIGETR